MVRYPQIPDWREFSKRPEHFGKDVMEVKRLFLIEQSRFLNEVSIYQNYIGMIHNMNMSSGGKKTIEFENSVIENDGKRIIEFENSVVENDYIDIDYFE